MKRSVFLVAFLILIIWSVAFGIRRGTRDFSIPVAPSLVLTEAGGQPFRWPRDLTCDPQGNVYLADTENNRLIKLSPSGTLLWSIGRLSQRPGELDHPTGLAFGGDRRIYVANTNDNRIDLFDERGRFAKTFARNIPEPCKVAVMPNGSVVVGAGEFTEGRYRASRITET